MMIFPHHSFGHPIDRLTSTTSSCLTVIMMMLLVTQISAIELCSRKTCSDPNARCIYPRYCTCKFGYDKHESSGLCFEEKTVGEKCSSSEQCELSDEDSTCDHSIGICVCKPGFKSSKNCPCSLLPSSTTPSSNFLAQIDTEYQRIVVTRSGTRPSFFASPTFIILSITVLIYLIKKTCNHCCRELPVNNENNSNSTPTSPSHQLPRPANPIINSRPGNNLNHNITPNELERRANHYLSNGGRTHESNLIASGSDKPPSYEEAVNHK